MTHIYLIAGESSGDVLGARLIDAMRSLQPDARFSGVGGMHMEEHGFSSLFPMRELSLMGLLEVLPNLRRLSRRLDETVADIAAKKPDIIVTIDSPGFTLRVLKRVAVLGIPRVHYVAPQVWAWREKRVKKFPGLWDRLLCLLPFEPEFFARHNLEAHFVGHPVLESGADRGNAERFRQKHGLTPDQKLLIVMPGSRHSEVGRILPVFGETVRRLTAQIPGLVPVVPVAAPVRDAVRAFDWPTTPILIDDPVEKYDAFAAASGALTKSGTSTLELALAGVPMLVCYRVNPITAMLVRRMIRIPYASIVNIIAGREVVPEMLQEDCTADKLTLRLLNLISDPEAAAAQRAACAPSLAALHPKGDDTPSMAAARDILGLLVKAG